MEDKLDMRSSYTLLELKTSLKPNFGLKMEKHDSKTLEVFLAAVEGIFLMEALKWCYHKYNNKTRYLQDILCKLKKPNFAHVPTNKLRSARLIYVD